jgi:protein involved in polysaccharide export with SLBB domain
MKKLFAIILLCGTVQQLIAQEMLPKPPAVLLPGALLRIRLSGVLPEDAAEINSQLFDVAPDGSVTLPNIGPVIVTGLTFAQAERVIEQTYVAQKIYRWPTITIDDGPHPRPPKALDAPGPSYRKHVKPLHVALSQ